MGRGGQNEAFVQSLALKIYIKNVAWKYFVQKSRKERKKQYSILYIII